MVHKFISDNENQIRPSTNIYVSVDDDDDNNKTEMALHSLVIHIYIVTNHQSKNHLRLPSVQHPRSLVIFPIT